jgi:hypothetical protein
MRSLAQAHGPDTKNRSLIRANMRPNGGGQHEEVAVRLLQLEPAAIAPLLYILSMAYPVILEV